MKLLGISLLFGWFVFAPAPCLWDYETLLMERSRFPSANELIVGQFRRHSPEFYRWRIEDREKKLQAEPENLSLLDDLAVAYEKIGDTDKAIELMQKKASLKPDQYETHANLGTFYIHKGEYEKGLAEIKAAIAINPDAHFGREVYQQMLVEYVISKQPQSADAKLLLPLAKEDWDVYREIGFAKFVLNAKGLLNEDGYTQDDKASAKEIEKAIKGVLGMMRFGNFDHPVLLESLSDLLLAVEDPKRRLAVRALLKASYECDDETVAAAYYAKATEAFEMQSHRGSVNAIPLAEIEQTFKNELAAGQAWFEQICADEKAWIEAGLDVESEYSKKYFKDPAFPRLTLFGLRPYELLFAIILGSILVIGLLRRVIRRTTETREIAKAEFIK